MFKDLLFVLWFFLPAGLANMTPVIAMRLPILSKWNTPIDLGKKIGSQPLLGKNKTWRGLVLGMVVSTAVLFVQVLLVEHSTWLADLTAHYPYQKLPIFILGPAFGFGALVGDAAKSFFKRRLNINPGSSWFPFDQTDYIIGTCLATAPFIFLSLHLYALLFVTWVSLHLLSSFIGYLLGLKEKPI